LHPDGLAGVAADDVFGGGEIGFAFGGWGGEGEIKNFSTFNEFFCTLLNF